MKQNQASKVLWSEYLRDPEPLVLFLIPSVALNSVLGADLGDSGQLDSTGLGRQFEWLPKVLFQYQETCFV